MTARSTASDAGEEASLIRQLELLLLPLHHRFRYPLTVPAHLMAGEGGVAAIGANLTRAPLSPALASAAPAGSSGADPAGTMTSHFSGDLAELSEQQQQECLHRSALRVVEEHVPDLLTWQSRVQRGATQAGNCYQVLERVRSSVSAMQRVTEAVQEQSDHLSHNASAMMVRKAKLELVRDALEQNLAHFTRIDDLCREAGNPFLKAGSARFSALLQDIAKEMEFLSTNAQYKSAKPYALKLAAAQQTVSAMLKDAVQTSFRTMELETLASPAFQAATQVLQEGGANPSDSPITEAFTSSSSSPLLMPAPATPPSSGGTAPTLQLRTHDVAGSFEVFLAAVNDAFVKSGDGFMSLRRMTELRQGGFSYTGAKAFGEERASAGDQLGADPGMREVMDSYCDARVGVVVPLLRYWLTLWYYLDAQQSSLADAKIAGSVAAAAAAAAVGAKSLADTGAARQQLSGVAEAHTLPQLAEHICALLQRSLVAELDVLRRLWLKDEIVSQLFPRLAPGIAEEVYYMFRSRLLCVDDVGELSQTVESIQRVSLLQNTGVQDSQVVSDLWVRMIQDTQERLVFRTSVYLRQTVSCCTPTREIASIYLRCGTDAYTADPAVSTGDDAPKRMFYIPGVVYALRLLDWLYPTLEFSVFSVFAEEAVHHSLDLVRQLMKLMRQIDSSDTLRDSKAFLCQLAHLQHLQVKLSYVDANITVVEKHISLAALRKRRLELEQSSRESKKEVEMDLLKCNECLTTAMFALVTQPVSGAAKKGEAERIQLVSEMKGRAAGMERMIAFYVEYGETQQDLVHLLRNRVAELAAEMNVDVHTVPAAPVKVASSATHAGSPPSKTMTPEALASTTGSATQNSLQLSGAEMTVAPLPPASASRPASTATGGSANPSHAFPHPSTVEAAAESTASAPVELTDATNQAFALPSRAPSAPSGFPSPPTERVTYASALPVATDQQPSAQGYAATAARAPSGTHSDTDLI
ncbi:Sec34like family [Leishmania braziliensis]|nr:Sec34like family [Leishmania braziliensis]